MGQRVSEGKVEQSTMCEAEEEHHVTFLNLIYFPPHSVSLHILFFYSMKNLSIAISRQTKDILSLLTNQLITVLQIA